ncbi:MAG: anthranilate phosphoribosyltransferase [Bacteroidetes bacterium]|nr:anthranilate phosphoribosyltransferase [Bacteroidota bacterium]
MIRETIARLVAGESISRDDAYRTMLEIMNGEATESQIAGFLVALRMKGETVDEIVGSALAMREKAEKLRVNKEIVLDTCGTGGDNAGTFNISTAAAIVASAAGAVVAKHGSRAVSSKSGSADVLKAIGLNLDGLDIPKVERALNEIGLAFLFAPLHHKSMRFAAPVRRDLGVRTLFNLLGPLTNPAGANRQLIGVYSKDLVRPIAEVLRDLGSQAAMVVNGDPTMDEISLCGVTHVAELKLGRIEIYEVTPEQFGFKRTNLSDLVVRNIDESVEAFMMAIRGRQSSFYDAVLLNAGAAIYVAGIERDINAGIKCARDVIKKGLAESKLHSLIEITGL